MKYVANFLSNVYTLSYSINRREGQGRTRLKNFDQNQCRIIQIYLEVFPHIQSSISYSVTIFLRNALDNLMSLVAITDLK